MVRNSGEEGLVITVATVAGLQLLVWHLPPWFYFLVSYPLSLLLGAGGVSRPHGGVSVPCGCV